MFFQRFTKRFLLAENAVNDFIIFHSIINLCYNIKLILLYSEVISIQQMRELFLFNLVNGIAIVVKKNLFLLINQPVDSQFIVKIVYSPFSNVFLCCVCVIFEHNKSHRSNREHFNSIKSFTSFLWYWN